VAFEPTPSGSSSGNGHTDSPADDLQELRELLLGPERRRLDEAERRLAAGIRPEQVAEHLPEAIVLRSARDRNLARALSPTIEGAISESVRRNPKEIATAIFPVLGPAIRKAIAETMAALVRSINTAIEHSFSVRGLRWRLESWRTGVPFADIVIRHSLVYRVEQVFLIHSETGLLLAHVAPRNLAVADADLVAGMMTAIQDFVADSFKVEDEGARLRTFSVGELTVYVERGPNAILAAVVRGEPPDTFRQRLERTLETVHLEFGTLFASFTGDSRPFQVTVPLLEECLETVLTREAATAARRRGTWLRWGVPALLVLGLFAWLVWRADRRWRAALRTVEAVPGVVVVNADRGWRRWKFAGLKDPIAADPAAALAAVGVDTAKVDLDWRPYLALDQPIVLERARRMLAPPATVRLALAGDSLRLAGTAPIAWLGRVALAGTLPAGIADVDLSGVAPRLADSLEGFRREIENRLVLFPIGSDEPAEGTSRQLNAIASFETALADAVADDGYQIGLDLIGRTDATGSDSVNRALSRLRAETVRDRLARRGIPVDAMRAVGIDGSSPLPGNEDVRAARNRSVAFVVRLERGRPPTKELR
jgi:OOP family OmpA-OmpF porin